MEPPTKTPRLAPATLAQAPHLAPAELAPPPPTLKTACLPADASMPCEFAALPDDVLYFVFAALPADARVRCALVCRAWAHALLRSPDAWRAWTRLDLSRRSGVKCTRNDETLEGAAALARGRLQELDLSNRGVRNNNGDDISLEQLLDVLRGSAELRELALDGVDFSVVLDPDTLQQLLAAAARTLRCFRADHVKCRSSAESLPLLRAEPPYGPLRTRLLAIDCRRDPPQASLGAAAGARSFAAALSHAWVRELSLTGVEWAEPAALEELTDALLARTCRVEELNLRVHSVDSGLSRAYLPALARLLAGSDGAALTQVCVERCDSLLIGASEGDVERLCAALRRSTLTCIVLHVRVLSGDAAVALFEAAAANPRLRFDLP